MIGSTVITGGIPSTGSLTVVSLPAGSFAITSTSSPSFKSPGFGTVQSPFESATVVTVVPSGNLTVTSVPGSVVPVIGSFGLIGSTVITGGIPSTVSVSSGDVLPAGSFTTAVTSSPSFKLPGFGTVQLPFESTIAVAVVPSGNLTITVPPGSPSPVIGSFGLIGLISGASGGV